MSWPARRRLAATMGMCVVLAACAIGSTPTPQPDCPTAAPSASEAQELLADVDHVAVSTDHGDFDIQIASDSAPIAAANFVALVRCGFYDGITFHRVIAGFVAQAGDPQTRDNRDDFAGLGTGGPGYRFIIEPPADGLNYDPYVVAMANSGGTDTNGSQFFINLADLDDRLQRLYTIIGRVTDGTDVVDAIGQVPTSSRDVPLDPVIIESMTVEAAPEAS
jgi:cyclophilin family peptidyl-prolyl cis-trans isomerase